MFFVPYDQRELEFFINNVKKFLNPGGVAVIQPYPFVYQTSGYKKCLKLLSKYQTIGHAPMPRIETYRNLVFQYIVITN